MSRNIRKYKAFDQRTGRLERAIDLVEDGMQPGIKTLKREADRKHPLSLPFRIGPDRIAKPEPTGTEFYYSYGYSLGPDLWRSRSLPNVSWNVGGVVLQATAVGIAERFVLEDISGTFLLETTDSLDGLDILILE